MKINILKHARHMRSLVAAGAALTGLLMMSGIASAQSASWYVSPNQAPTYPGHTSLRSVLDSAASFSQLPIAFDVEGTSGQISLTGHSYTRTGGGIVGANGHNYFYRNYLKIENGSAIIDFDTEQKFFSMRWGSVDTTNMVSFYNGTQLVQTVTGAQALAAATSISASGSYDAGFSFGELGFTRVVASTDALWMEIADFSVSDTVDVAPIPLNAASLGGLMSFLMMLGLRGKGGTQVAIRMALASIMPRRRVLA